MATKNGNRKEVKAKVDNGQIGNWAILLGLIVSLPAIVKFNLPYNGLILLVLGVVGGYMLVSDKDSTQFIIYTLGIWLGLKALGGLFEVSPLLSGVVVAMENVFTLFSAASLVVALKAMGKAVGLIK